MTENLKLTLPLKCIMLIDDDEATNFLNKMVLESHGLAESIVAVHGGQEALDYLTGLEEHGGERPNLLLLDVNMPGMNGWEFLDHYKNLDKHHRGDALLVMLTTSLNPDDRARAEAIEEIDSFLNKPLEGETLVEVLRSIMH